MRRTLDNWQQEYNCEPPCSSLAYRTPAAFQAHTGYGDVKSKLRFPHPQSPDYDDGEIYPLPNWKPRLWVVERNGRISSPNLEREVFE